LFLAAYIRGPQRVFDFFGPFLFDNNMADYQAQREKNIQANKALLLSLGLEQLQNFAPAAVGAPVPKPQPKPKAAAVKAKPKAKEPQKRKRDDAEDAMSVDGDAKAPRLDEEDGRRRSSRRGVKPATYNEDRLFERKEKEATDAKIRSQELGEDRTGRAGNRLGQRKHDPYVGRLATVRKCLTLFTESNSDLSQALRLELGGRRGEFGLAFLVSSLTPSISGRNARRMRFMLHLSLVFMGMLQGVLSPLRSLEDTTTM